jgi:mannose-1-phosphate guanylyltransferase
MDDDASRSHTWTVVLGSTFRVVPSWPSEIGTPLVQTLDLATSISDPERVVTTLAACDPLDAHATHPALALGRVLREPVDRGTACSLFLALGHIQAVDPDALIVVLPTDHFVHPAHEFGARVATALEAARRLDRIVVLGVAPTSIETAHGWILPGSPIARVSQLEVRRVEVFIDQPSRDLAALIRDTGGLWSTMFLAAPLGRVWASGRRGLPEVLSALEPFVDFAGRPFERSWLEATYDRLPHRSIAAHFLHRLGEELAVAELDQVSWCDWDCSRRILDALHEAGGLAPSPSS